MTSEPDRQTSPETPGEPRAVMAGVYWAIAGVLLFTVGWACDWWHAKVAGSVLAAAGCLSVVAPFLLAEARAK